VLKEFFQLGRSGYTHKRVRSEIERCKAKQEVLRANGRKGGLSKVANAKQMPSKSLAFQTLDSRRQILEPETHTTTTASEPQGFLLFVENYPQDHVGIKSEAMRAWMEIPSAEIHLGEILSGLEIWKGSARWTDEGGRYVPNAVKFLRAKQWRTKPPTSIGGKNGQHDYSSTFKKRANL
jgi:hypothetical protein